MSASMHIVCPHCNVENRVPENRISEQPKCGKCHLALFNTHPVELSETGFQKHSTRSDIPLVVDFWAPWCGPCRMMAPQFEQAAAELEPLVRLAKVNTEAEQSIGARFNVRSIPTLIIFHRGRELARRSGAMRASDIVHWVRATTASVA